MIGTWPLSDIHVAIKEYDAKIVCLYELWQYETVQYDSQTKTDGLFNKYIDKFIAIKIESSPLPAEFKNKPNGKQLFAEKMAQRNIHLDIDEMIENPTRRYIGKCTKLLVKYIK